MSSFCGNKHKKEQTNVACIWSLDNQLALEQKGFNKSTLNHREWELSDKIKVNFDMTSCINLYGDDGKALVLDSLTY